MDNEIHNAKRDLVAVLRARAKGDELTVQTLLKQSALTRSPEGRAVMLEAAVELAHDLYSGLSARPEFARLREELPKERDRTPPALRADFDTAIALMTGKPGAKWEATFSPELLLALLLSIDWVLRNMINLMRSDRFDVAYERLALGLAKGLPPQEGP